MLKNSMIHRQHIIFISMMCTGAFLIVMSQLVDLRLLSEGIAFLTVGFVGILMSWTTFDIGNSIKETIRETSAENRVYLERLSRILESLQKSQEQFQKSLQQTMESQNRIENKLNSSD